MTRGDGVRDLRAATKNEATIDLQVETFNQHHVMLLQKELNQSACESRQLREELCASLVRLKERLNGHEPTEKERQAAAAAGIKLPDNAAVELQRKREQLASARKHAELRELADKVEKSEQKTKELMDNEEIRVWRIWKVQLNNDVSLVKESKRAPGEMDEILEKLIPIVQNIFRATLGARMKQ